MGSDAAAPGDPRLLRLTMGGSFDGTLGSDPEHQDRPRHGPGVLILHSPGGDDHGELTDVAKS